MRRISHVVAALAIVSMVGTGSACSSSSPSGRATLVNLATTRHQQLLAARAEARRLAQRHRGFPAAHLLVWHHLEHRRRGLQWWFDHQHSLRYVLLDPHSDVYTTFSVTTKPGQQLAAVELNVLYPDGRFRRFTRRDCVTQSDGAGRTTYKFVYPRAARGMIIDERYTLRYANAWQQYRHLWSHQLRLQSSVPIALAQARLVFPPGFSVRFKRLRGHKWWVRWKRVGKSWHLIYRRVNTPPLPNEPYTASRAADSSHLRVQVYRMGPLWGRGMPHTWGQLANLARAVWMNHRHARYYLRDYTRRLVRGKSREEAQRLIVRNVQTLYRVRGDEGFRWSLTKVLRRAEGTRLQLTALAYLMLTQVNIPAELVLIHPEENGRFDPQFVSPTELDVPALLLAEGKRGVLAFPWLKGQPIGQVPPALRARNALRIQSSGAYRFFKTRTLGGRASRLTQRYDMRIDASGRVRVTEREIYEGELAVRLRRSLVRLSAAARREVLRRRQLGADHTGRLGALTLRGLTKPRRPLEITARYDMVGRLLRSPGAAVLRLVPVSPHPLPSLLARDRRYRPLHRLETKRLVWRYDVRYPETWRLLAAPPRRSFDNAFGRVVVEIQRLRQRVIVRQEIEFRRTTRPRKELGKLRALLGAVQRGRWARLEFATP